MNVDANKNWPLLNTPTHIVWHCSGSEFGDAATIQHWHTDPKPRGNGWSRIGYHAVVLNGLRHKSDRRYYKPAEDGVIEYGVPLGNQGIHCPSMNASGLAICLIGDRCFTLHQLHNAIVLSLEWSWQFGISLERVIGHYETPKQQALPPNQRKACPTIDMNLARTWLRTYNERKISG